MSVAETSIAEPSKIPKKHGAVPVASLQESFGEECSLAVARWSVDVMILCGNWPAKSDQPAISDGWN